MGVFDDEGRRPARSKRDSELTLGSAMLLVVFFGVVVLCGVSFGTGYILGSRASSDGPVFQSQQSATGTGPLLTQNAPQTKPVAATQLPAASTTADGTQAAQGTTPNTTPGTTASTTDGTVSAMSGTTSGAAQGANETATAGGTPYAVTGVAVQPPDDNGWHRAVATFSNQPSTSGAGGSQPAAAEVHPAMAGTSAASALMVQIAAVADQHDADVLLRALREHGYRAEAVHDPADNLIHICMGPYYSKSDADSMRNQLLNGGYNAVVRPW